MLGLALGLALAFLRERLDRRLRTPEDVEAQFDMPVLARVPRKGRSETFRHRVPRGPPDPAHQPPVRQRRRPAAVDRGHERRARVRARPPPPPTSRSRAPRSGSRCSWSRPTSAVPSLQRELMPARPSRCVRGSATTSSRPRRSTTSIFPTGRPGVEHHRRRTAAAEPVGAARVAPRAHRGGGVRRGGGPRDHRLPATHRSAPTRP